MSEYFAKRIYTSVAAGGSTSEGRKPQFEVLYEVNVYFRKPQLKVFYGVFRSKV